METNELYDVIIVGGGPAGLSIGSELSSKNKILLIDKNVAGKTHRSWFVPLDAIHKEDLPYTYTGVTRFMTNTFSTRTFGGAEVSWKTELFNRYPYVNEKTILPHWLDIMKQNNAEIIDKCTYLDSENVDGGVTVKTSKGTFKSRMLIDASGHDSPILKKYEINRGIYYWWSVYGCIGEHPNGMGDMDVGDYMMWQTFRDTNAHINTSMENGRPIFSYEILDENTSFSFIFYLRTEKMPLDVMKKEYMDVLRNEDSTKNFHDIKISELKYGWYPSGGLSQQLAEDNVVFVGDAGCWTTPCGWGMTFILRNYRHFANQIGVLLDENKLDKKSLLSVPHYKGHEKYEVLLDTIVTHFLANASAHQLDRFINLFKEKIPKILCEKIFTLTISQEEILVMFKAMLSQFDLRELVHVLPKKDFLILLDEAKYFEDAEDAVIEGVHEEVHKLFNHFSKHKVKSTLNNGFDFS